MKKVFVLILICLVVVCPVLLLSGCTMSATPEEIADKFVDVAKGYVATATKGGRGDSVTFEMQSEKTFNSVVLKEKGDKITDYELYVDGKMIYKSDFIGKYKYCSFPAVTAKSITLKVVGCDGSWNVTDFEAYNITKTAKEDFEVMSYLIVDRALKLTEDQTALMKYTTQFNLFGSVYYDKEGHLHFQDFLIDGKSVPGRTALAQAIEIVHKYNPSAKIVYTVLGNLDVNGDGLNVEKRSDQAMGKHYDTLIKECIDVMQEFGLDGIAFDYESPHNPISHGIYGKFLERLKKAMPQGKTLSAAFGLWHLTVVGCFPFDKLKYVDSIEFMAYDGFDERGNHAAFYTMCADAIDQLQRKGINMSKVHWGLPFYSRPSDQAEYWGDYVSAAQKLGVWGNSFTEEITVNGKTYEETLYYNGRQMIYDKTCYAMDMGLGGVMIWHFTCDTTNEELSLYGAINEAIISRK